MEPKYEKIAAEIANYRRQQAEQFAADIKNIAAEIKNFRRQQAVDAVLHVLILIGIVYMALKVAG